MARIRTANRLDWYPMTGTRLSHTRRVSVKSRGTWRAEYYARQVLIKPKGRAMQLGSRTVSGEFWRTSSPVDLGVILATIHAEHADGDHVVQVRRRTNDDGDCTWEVLGLHDVVLINDSEIGGAMLRKGIER